MKTDVAPNGASFPQIVAGGATRLYFVADDGSGRDLWSLDASSPSTRPEKLRLNPDGPFNPDQFVEAGGRLYVAGSVGAFDDPVPGRQLWSIDLNAATATPVQIKLVPDGSPAPLGVTLYDPLL